MPRLIPSLKAREYLQGSMTACSWEAGWRSLLLRAYRDPPHVEELTTPATADHLIVLVTGGACDIEGRYRRRWERAHYQPGNIGMTAAGEEVKLRWNGAHTTLQLHLPAATLQRVAEDLSGGTARAFALPSVLTSVDPMIEQVMLGMERAMAAGAPDLYAETAGDFLAAHLLVHHAGVSAVPPPSREDARLRRVDAFMHQNLSAPLSLSTLARVAGISPFHFLRLFKQTYGEPPLRRLTRLRMEEAQRRLAQARESVTEIAFLCGYENPTHFASAFRRAVGVSPRAYRRGAR